MLELCKNIWRGFMNLKKIISITTIVCFCVSACILITGIFGVSVFEGVVFKMLITFACLAAGGYFTINAINLYAKNKALSIVSISLIGLSILGILINTYFEINAVLFGRMVFTLALVSVLFNVVVNNVLNFGKNLLALQIIIYVIILACIILAVLSIFEVGLSEAMTKIMISLIVLSVVGIIVLSVIKKKQPTDGDLYGKVMITKAEYNTLLFKANEYDKLIIEKNNEAK